MLSEATRIDATLRSKEGEIVLMISAHLDWKTNPKTVKQLDEKLRNYIHYIEGGQYSQDFGNDPVFIQIMTAHALSPEAEKLVKKVQRTSGIEIKTTVMGAYGSVKKRRGR